MKTFAWLTGETLRCLTESCFNKRLDARPHDAGNRCEFIVADYYLLECLLCWRGSLIRRRYRGRTAPFTSVERFRAHLRATQRKSRGVGLSVCASIESAIAEIAHSGYPEATSTGSACASQALCLFVGDTVACLDRDG
jgi:hypothetical protein